MINRIICPFHIEEQLRSISVSNISLNEPGRLKKFIITNTYRYECINCTFLNRSKCDQYQFFQPVNRNGGCYNANYIAYESISINQANTSVGIHYYSTDIEIELWQINDASIGIHLPKKIQTFSINYPTIPQLVDLQKLIRGFRLNNFVSDWVSLFSTFF